MFFLSFLLPIEPSTNTKTRAPAATSGFEFTVMLRGRGEDEKHGMTYEGTSTTATDNQLPDFYMRTERLKWLSHHLAGIC